METWVCYQDTRVIHTCNVRQKQGIKTRMLAAVTENDGMLTIQYRRNNDNKRTDREVKTLQIQN